MYDIYRVNKTNLIIKMIKYFIFTDHTHVHILVSSIINLCFNPKTHHKLVRGLNMDHLMPMRYVSFSYLSKVKSGERLCIGR